MRRRGTGRHPWLLPVFLAAAAAGIVYAFDVDAPHAWAIIAAAAVLGLCNDIVEGLETFRLAPAKLRAPETGLTDLQFLAYSLTTGNRPIGERAYLRFRTVALRRFDSLGLSIGGASNTSTLHRMLTDPQRGHRMNRQQLNSCLDELDALLPEGKQNSR